MNLDPFLRNRGVATAGMILGLGAFAVGCGGETRTVTATSPQQSNIGRVCKWSKEHPQPLVSEHPVKMRVDSRCNPDASGDYSAPAGIYKESNFGSQSVGHINNGVIVDAQCYDPRGQTTYDSRGEATGSKVWIKVHDAASRVTGMLSDVNLGFSPYKKLDRC